MVKVKRVKKGIGMKKALYSLVLVCLLQSGSLCYGFDFDIPEEEVSSSVQKHQPLAEDDLSFDDMQKLVNVESTEKKIDPIIYSSVPEDKKREEEVDPTDTVFRKSAKKLKSLTYDLLPEELKGAMSKYVFDPVAKHIMKNFKVGDLEFKRIPAAYTPGEKEHSFLIFGTLTLYNQQVRAVLREITLKEGEKPRYSLTLELTQGLKLSDIAQELKVIDLDVKRMQMIFSDVDYDEQELGGIQVKKGLNIVGDIQMVGSLSPIKKLSKLQQLRMFGSIKKELVGSSLYGLIPGEVFLGRGVTLTKMLAGVKVDLLGPRFLIQGALKLPVKGLDKTKKDFLTLTSTLELGPEKAALKGFLDGMWTNALGIKGLSIGQVGVGASVLYAGALIDGLELTGSIGVGDKMFNLASKGDLTEGAAFVASMDGSLSFKDIAAFTNKTLGAKLPVDTIFKALPNPTLENAQLYIVPISTTILNKNYPAGNRFEGGISFFGKKTLMKIALDSDGLKGSALLPEITIPGLLSFKGTKNEDGSVKLPEVSLVISNKTPSKFYAKAFVQLAPAVLGGASADGILDFTSKGTTITMQSKLFNFYTFDIALEGSSSFSKQPVDFTIKASMAAEGGLKDLATVFRNEAYKIFGKPEDVGIELKENTNKCFKAKGFDLTI